MRPYQFVDIIGQVMLPKAMHVLHTEASHGASDSERSERDGLLPSYGRGKKDSLLNCFTMLYHAIPYLKDLYISLD